jgi:hypothetical protein
MINGFNTSEDFLKDYLNQKEYVYLTCVTYDWVEMTYNWFLHLKKLNQENNVLVVALDNNCYLELQKLNIPSVLIETNINPDNIENKSSMFTKLNCIGYIGNKYKIDIIHSEVDIIILKNPLENLKIQIQDYDIAISSNKFYKTSLKLDNNIKEGIDTSFGFCYVPYYKNKDFIDALNFNFEWWETKLKQNNIKNVDFLLQNNNSIELPIVNIFTKFNIKTKTLNIIEYANGDCFFTNFIKEKILNDAITLHYNNCTFSNDILENRDSKIQLMKENNHWLV